MKIELIRKIIVNEGGVGVPKKIGDIVDLPKAVAFDLISQKSAKPHEPNTKGR